MKAGFTLVLTISLGRGARCWVEEEALIGLHQYHTVEKTHQAMIRKCVWSGFVGLSGILRFLKNHLACRLLIRFFRGFSVNFSFSFVSVILVASFQASSSFYSTGFPM